MGLKIKLVNSLEKVFLDTEPVERPEDGIFSGFRNETISFQIAYTLTTGTRAYVEAEIVSPLKDWVRVRSVKHVPVRFSTFQDSTDNYLRTTPGLYPDLLSDIRPHSLRAYENQWDTLWIDVDPDATTPAGVYPVEVQLKKQD